MLHFCEQESQWEYQTWSAFDVFWHCPPSHIKRVYVTPGKKQQMIASVWPNRLFEIYGNTLVNWNLAKLSFSKPDKHQDDAIRGQITLACPLLPRVKWGATGSVILHSADGVQYIYIFIIIFNSIKFNWTSLTAHLIEQKLLGGTFKCVRPALDHTRITCVLCIVSKVEMSFDSKTSLCTHLL